MKLLLYLLSAVSALGAVSQPFYDTTTGHFRDTNITYQLWTDPGFIWSGQQLGWGSGGSGGLDTNALNAILTVSNNATMFAVSNSTVAAASTATYGPDGNPLLTSQALVQPTLSYQPSVPALTVGGLSASLVAVSGHTIATWGTGADILKDGGGNAYLTSTSSISPPALGSALASLSTNNASGLTNLSAANLTGTLALGVLPSGVVTNNWAASATSLQLSNAVTVSVMPGTSSFIVRRASGNVSGGDLFQVQKSDGTLVSHISDTGVFYISSIAGAGVALGYQFNGDIAAINSGQIGFLPGSNIGVNNDAYLERGGPGLIIVDTNLNIRGTLTASGGVITNNGIVWWSTNNTPPASPIGSLWSCPSGGTSPGLNVQQAGGWTLK